MSNTSFFLFMLISGAKKDRNPYLPEYLIHRYQLDCIRPGSDNKHNWLIHPLSSRAKILKEQDTKEPEDCKKSFKY